MSGGRVVLGRIVGLYGVRGWVKVFSHTQPRENIVEYPVWLIRRGEAWQQVPLEAGRRHGKGVIAKLAGVDDRDAAAGLLEAEVAVPREALPPAGSEEYYWADLEGLEVKTRDGVHLGRVSHLLETGANDVLVVRGERERLIPYTPGRAVERVDLESGLITVDWDPEF